MSLGVSFRKLRRDLVAERGRALLMVGALAVSLFGVGAVLSAYGILEREVTASYLGSKPAAAALELEDAVTPEMVTAARQRPLVAEAARGDIVQARVKVGEDWRPLLLFVVDDFLDQRLNVFRSQSGAWPPPLGTMLIERSAASVLRATEGDKVWVKPPSAPAREVPIVGVVHDQGLAPAWQEAEGYGYITPDTLAWLGETGALHELRFALKETPFDGAAIERAVADLQTWLASNGHRTSEARVPPPGRHPHQNQMNGVIFLLLSFSAVALLLSGVLVASSLSAMLARQVREIGLMKTVGARPAQIFLLYAWLLGAMGWMALLPAIPTGMVAGRALATMSANMLNLRLASWAIPPWVFGVQAAAGLIVPMVIASAILWRAASMTVRQAMDQHGVAPLAAPKRRVARLSCGRSGLWALAIRNAFRRRSRLVLTVGLLAAGGATFMAARNLVRGWDGIVERVFSDRHYDVEIRVEDAPGVAEALRTTPGVRLVESWSYSPSALSHPGRLDTVRTYPDGSHGSLSMVGVPATTTLISFPLLEGRWLRPDDTDAVVFSHMVKGQAPDVKVGDAITLSCEGRPFTWRVVGIVEEVGAAGMAYVTREAFARAVGGAAKVAMLRLATTATTPQERTEIVRRLEGVLEKEGVHVKAVIPLAVLRTAMGDHVLVLVRLLLALAALMTIVGTMGLASAMSTAVIERTRELAIMKTIGARPRQIVLLVVYEALVVSFLSWVVAVAASWPASLWIGGAVGVLSFRVPLPLVIDGPAIAAWLVGAGLVALVAVWLPGRRAASLSVRDGLMAL